MESLQGQIKDASHQTGFCGAAAFKSANLHFTLLQMDLAKIQEEIYEDQKTKINPSKERRRGTTADGSQKANQSRSTPSEIHEQDGQV